jgi:signal transduction histidine kinase
VLVTGMADYLLGFELSFQVFYIVPVCLAVAAVGWRFGVLTAIASVLSTLVGDFAAGARYVDPVVPAVNAVFALGTYLAVVWLFQIMLTLQREMEGRVRQRTAALQSVMAERERLEKALLEISERERRSIGHDLHDGLGQHLTGTALAGQVLEEKLEARHLVDEIGDVRKIGALIEEAIEKTRRLAKGLLLAEIQPKALLTAFQELAEDISSEFRARCEFRHEGEVQVADTATATHLFHITQEAVHNAIRHGKAKHILITWAAAANDPTLTITDNGTGLPSPAVRGKGLGLSIMAHRAEIIDWRFSIDRRPEGGTIVTCRPVAPSTHS